jgi:hypothetical protein
MSTYFDIYISEIGWRPNTAYYRSVFDPRTQWKNLVLDKLHKSHSLLLLYFRFPLKTFIDHRPGMLGYNNAQLDQAMPRMGIRE